MRREKPLPVTLDGGYPTDDPVIRYWHDLITEIEQVPRPDLAVARDRVEEILHAAKRHDDGYLWARGQLVFAHVLFREGRHERAIEILDEALSWAEVHHKRLLQAQAHRLYARLYRMVGEFAQAVEHSRSAVAFVDASTHPRELVGHLTSLADTLWQNGAQEEALKVFEDALTRAHHIEDWLQYAIICNNRAYYRLLDNRFDEALVDCERGAQALATHKMDPYLNGMDTWAQVLLGLNQPREALNLLTPLTEAEIFANSPSAVRCSALLTMAKAHLALNEPQAADRNLHRASTIAHAAGELDVEIDALIRRAELQAALNQHAIAFTLERRALQLTQELQQVRFLNRPVSLRMHIEVEKAKKEREDFRQLAFIDPLTALHNRRHLETEFPSVVTACTAENLPLSLLLLDIDHFKRINDRFSHQSGDRVLQIVAELLSDVVEAARPNARPEQRRDRVRRHIVSEAREPLATAHHPRPFACRIGGEELLLVLPGVGASHASTIAADIVDGVRKHPWRVLHQDLTVTASIGVVTGMGAMDQTQLLRKVDANLYAAKRAGRDQFIHSQETNPTHVTAVHVDGPTGQPAFSRELDLTDVRVNKKPPQASRR